MRIYLTCLSALTLAVPAQAQDVGRMETVIDADVKSGEFMGAVLVAKDGKVLLDKGYGLADIEWNIPNDGQTKYRIGSLTKQFTGVALLLLQERGKLNLDDPIKTYVPQAPGSWKSITLRHLLHHTAGIPNLTSLPDFAGSKTLPATLDELIARFSNLPLEFKPGEKMAYSNSGYILLGAVIEKVSGQSYSAFLSDAILKPLGMADTGYDVHGTIVLRRASGYTPSPKGVVNADYVDMSIPHAAGALYSTTRDLLKWQQALFSGKVLKPASFSEFLTVGKGDYALGVVVQKENGHTLVQHSGGIEGFNTWLGYDVENRITVAILANLNGGAPEKLGGQLIAIGRGEKILLNSERKAIALPAATLQDYVGIYPFSPAFSIAVARTDSGISAQGTGQPAFALEAEAVDNFFTRAVEARITFQRDAIGKVHSLTLHQAGRSMVAKKSN